VKPRAPKRRTYHHGDLPAALLDAADALVAEKGPAGFSLREAARVVGVDPAACYRHFRDREAILQALARRGFTRLAATLAAVVAESRARPAGVIAELGRAYVRFALDHPSAFRAMFGPHGVDSRDPLLRGDYPDGIGAYERLQRAIAAWSEAEALKLDLEQASLALWSGVHGLACLLIDGALRVADPTSVVDATVATVIAGLRGPRTGRR
jgi:AcrR family transcriptional regulator